MHCTGHTSTHARSLTSMHASVMIARPAIVRPCSPASAPAHSPGRARAERLGAQCAADDALRDFGELAVARAGMVAQQRERLVDSDPHVLGENTLRLLDRDARLERGLQLR